MSLLTCSFANLPKLLGNLEQGGVRNAKINFIAIRNFNQSEKGRIQNKNYSNLKSREKKLEKGKENAANLTEPPLLFPGFPGEVAEVEAAEASADF